MEKEQIIAARNLNISDMLEAGFTLDELFKNGEINTEYYGPSGSYEYFDGENFYNAAGQQLRNPDEYYSNSEGYTRLVTNSP